jgi:taurine dioxygenase
MMSSSSQIEIKPRAYGFGAEISGVDLDQPIEPEVLGVLRSAFTEHRVLSVPRQRFDPAGLERFSAQLGPFGHDPYVAPMDGHQHVIEVSREAQETAPIFGSLWHSDWSFQATPPSATVLFGAEIPPVGGDTVFADTCRAYESLSPTLQALLKTLKGVHSAAPAYGPKGLFARDDASRSMRIIVSPEADKVEVHPLVRRHPESGRYTLYVNHVYTIGIEGMRVDESKALLDFLFKHMTQAEYVYRHRWQAGTVVMWDNRCVVHYAEGGYAGHRRLMYRTTLAGERPAM